MKRFLPALMMLATGCSHIQYRENGVEFDKFTFGTITQLAEFSVDRSPTGLIIFKLSGAKSDQVQALEKVAEGVAKGLAQGVKP